MKHSTTNTTYDIRKALSDLLLPVDLTALVTLDARTKRISIGGEPIDDARLNNLRAEAEFLVQSDLWKILVETPKELVQRSMFVSGETMDDIKRGRSVLFLLDTQKKIVDTFLNTVKK